MLKVLLDYSKLGVTFCFSLRCGNSSAELKRNENNKILMLLFEENADRRENKKKPKQWFCDIRFTIHHDFSDRPKQKSSETFRIFSWTRDDVEKKWSATARTTSNIQWRGHIFSVLTNRNLFLNYWSIFSSLIQTQLFTSCSCNLLWHDSSTARYLMEPSDWLSGDINYPLSWGLWSLVTCLVALKVKTHRLYQVNISSGSSPASCFASCFSSWFFPLVPPS